MEKFKSIYDESNIGCTGLIIFVYKKLKKNRVIINIAYFTNVLSKMQARQMISLLAPIL